MNERGGRRGDAHVVGCAVGGVTSAVVQAPVAYPSFLGGLALAGVYALRRDLWSCVLLQAPL